MSAAEARLVQHDFMQLHRCSEWKWTFFDGLRDAETIENAYQHSDCGTFAKLLTGDAHEQQNAPKLIGAYWRIADPDFRRQMLDLVQMLAEQARTHDIGLEIHRADPVE
jgi:hypothetical protein